MDDWISKKKVRGQIKNAIDRAPYPVSRNYSVVGPAPLLPGVFIPTLKTRPFGPSQKRLTLPLFRPWGDGILECWNTGFVGIRSFSVGRHGPENKIRPSSAFDPRYSIVSSFHFSRGHLMAKAAFLW